jgi:hypothetical protein
LSEFSRFYSNFLWQKPYQTFDEAFLDAKKTKILGIIQFSSNFTESLRLFNGRRLGSNLTDDGFIKVYLDNTNMQLNAMIQEKLYNTYKKFLEGLMTGCGNPKTAGSSPIVTEALFGEINFNMKVTMNAGVALS